MPEPADQGVRQEIVGLLDAELAWYTDHIRANRAASVALRALGVAAFVATGVLAALPGERGWSSLAGMVAASAGLLAADRVFGFTEAWARYELARRKLQALRRRLDANPAEQALLDALLAVVLEETTLWAAQAVAGRDALARLLEPVEGRMKAALAPASGRAGLSVALVGAAPEARWRLRVDGQDLGGFAGPAGAVTSERSGPVVVEVALEGGPTLARAAALAAGEVTELGFELRA